MMGDKVLVDKVKLRKWFWIHRAAIKSAENIWVLEAGYYTDRIHNLEKDIDDLHTELSVRKYQKPV